MKEKLWKIAISGTMCLTLMSSGCGEKQEVKTESHEIDALKASENQTLPYFGEFDIEFRKTGNGTSIADTVYYSLPKFSFTNQDGKEVSHRTYENKIFIADFFFTECPTICPILSSQMVRLQAMVKKEGLSGQVMFLSHSVKPEHDTPEVLKAYGDQLGVDFSNWNFVTGKAADIYELAEEGYMLSAFPSAEAEGGIFHTDKITLVDADMHIRGYYDGTSTKSVDQLFIDLKKLLREKPAHAATHA